MTKRDVLGRERPRRCGHVFPQNGSRCPSAAMGSSDFCRAHLGDADDAMLDAPAAAAVEPPPFDH